MSNFDSIAIIGGTGCNGKMFLSLKDALSKLFPDVDLFDVDLPGHADFTILKYYPYSLESYGDYVSEIIQGLPGKVIVIGHSLGGTVSLYVGIKRLANVVGIVNMDGAEQFSVLQYPEGKQQIYDILQQVIPMLVDPEGKNPDLLKSALAVVDKDFKIDCDADLRYQISSIDVPVLLFAGEDDVISLAVDRERMQTCIPNSAIKTIPGDHGVPILNGNATALAIKEWLDDVGLS